MDSTHDLVPSEPGIAQQLERWLDGIAGAVDARLSPLVLGEIAGVPFIVYWLVLAGLITTVHMRFVQVRAFGHALAVVAGRYDRNSGAGEVTHRQALVSALSATVGLGNIAGVALALSIGGPGATFWMIVAGLFGMALKFTECTLGQLHRKVDPSGRVSGGPMHYLRDGLAQVGRPRLGRILALVFTLTCLGASFGGGNVFQINQSLDAVGEVFPVVERHRWVYGALLAAATGFVVLGGIRSIARTAERIVPLMCLLYLVMAAAVLVLRFEEVPQALHSIVRGAFTDDAAYGGFFGVLARGFRRAAFSNEAGTGSAAIAHAAARTDEPVREGIVALLEPFLDTVCVCTVTALVILVTGAHVDPDPALAAARQSGEGARLTLLALSGELAWTRYLLALVVVAFAFSTVITWSYYGERCARELLGPRASLPYRILFVAFVFVGSQVQAGNAKNLSDTLLLGLALPNVLGLYFLLPRVRGELDGYLARLRRGDFDRR